MADYSKWDKLADDSDDEEVQRERERAKKESERLEKLQKDAEVRDEISRWLKFQIQKLRRKDDSGVPELCVRGHEPRWLDDNERAVLAMFMAVVHFEKYDINIARHHDIMNIARQNRWLEEDPGTQELLCRLHRNLVKSGSEGGGLYGQDKVMEGRLTSAINTLAAPVYAGCPGGYGKIYELFAVIGDPKSKTAWDVREKYMKQEYAADALFDSIVPPEPNKEAGGGDPYDDVVLFGPGFWLALKALLLCSSILVFFLLWHFGYVGGGGPGGAVGAIDDTPRGYVPPSRRPEARSPDADTAHPEL